MNGQELCDITAESFDLDCFTKVLNRHLLGFGLEAYPFNSQWYNEFRDFVSSSNPQKLATPEANRVAFICISNRDFFKRVVSKFDPGSDSTSFVDNTVDEVLRETLCTIHPSLAARGSSTDKPPYVHVQTMGHVAGVDEYISASEITPASTFVTGNRDPDLWGDLTNKILGVSIHPKYGGWYAYRMLIILDGVTWPSDKIRGEPLKFLCEKDKETIICEYNSNSDLCRWRDFNDDASFKLHRYDSIQYAFFTERSIQKRRRILELLKSDV